MTHDEGCLATEDIIALDITIAAMTPAHCRPAFAWAERLGQAKAYDGFYLALAEELVHCQGSCASLATEWRLKVARPFKAGLPGDDHRVRGLKPSATLSRHSVTHTASNPAKFP